MKRMVIGMMIVIVLMGLSSGCVQNQMESGEANKIEKINFAENQLYAVAYLGYENLEDFSFYADKYLLSDNVPIHYFSPGEYYLVIPRYANTDLLLYNNDMDTMSTSLVYEEKEMRPFIIQCNISDIYSDVTICLIYQGEKVEFSPYISLKDGSVQVGERGINITK